MSEIALVLLLHELCGHLTHYNVNMGKCLRWHLSLVKQRQKSFLALTTYIKKLCVFISCRAEISD